MINGSTHGYCQAHKGLRQGDPLSSFLFAIVRAALNRLIVMAGEVNPISGFIPPSNALVITHLQFADDTIIFCAADED